MHLVYRFLANLLGLWLVVHLVNGFQIHDGWRGYLIVGVVLALLNLLVKPLLRFLTFPLIVLTLGLFGLVINALILWLASQFAPVYLNIADTVALLTSTIILTAVNLASHWL